ncbi:MAG TPA: hypothetical protein VM597_14645 [Gemmataceae bacterium]|nr:hypothetical protein [Gemmataceae bacterium]
MSVLAELVDLLYLPTLVVGTLMFLAQLEDLLRTWVAYRRR